MRDPAGSVEIGRNQVLPAGFELKDATAWNILFDAVVDQLSSK
jgi:hypothetical protein